MLHEALCTPSYPPPQLLHRTPDTTEFSRVPFSEHASSVLSTQLSRHFYLPSSRRDSHADLRRFILCLAEHQRADELTFLKQHARRLHVRLPSSHAPKLTKLSTRTHPIESAINTSGCDTKARPKTTPVLPKADPLPAAPLPAAPVPATSPDVAAAPVLATSPDVAAAPVPATSPEVAAQSLEAAEAEYAALARTRAPHIFLAHNVPSIHDMQLRRRTLPKLPRPSR